MLYLMMVVGAVGACMLIAGVGYGCRSGFSSGTPGFRYSITGLILLFVGFGLPLLGLAMHV